MVFPSLKVVAVKQAGDRLTAVFNDGRTVGYSISMLDSEFEEVQSARGEVPVKRLRAKKAWGKRPVSGALPLRSLRSRKVS